MKIKPVKKIKKAAYPTVAIAATAAAVSMTLSGCEPPRKVGTFASPSSEQITESISSYDASSCDTTVSLEGDYVVSENSSEITSMGEFISSETPSSSSVNPSIATSTTQGIVAPHTNPKD